MTPAHLKDLETTIAKLASKGKGILAADESIPTISKRFAALNIPSTAATRLAYRELLVTTPGISDYIAGVILFTETLEQTTSSGSSFASLLEENGLLTGVKVDKGLVPIPTSPTEQMTQGLDDLGERLADYKSKGASFAKWRAVYHISAQTPSGLALRTNAESLASYAALCQAHGIVPMVEPEILIDGDYSIEQAAATAENVLHALFHALFKHRVKLEYIVLKPSMVIHGKQAATPAAADAIAKHTLAVFGRTVPAAVPTINFLSGGQAPEAATLHLNAINQVANNPWNISYSYARALQDYCMQAWLGETKNVARAQQIFLQRARLNSLASVGKYTPAAEQEKSTA